MAVAAVWALAGGSPAIELVDPVAAGLLAVNIVFLLIASLGEGGEGEGQRRIREAGKAVAALNELLESVGDIPRIKLESKLTPVLLKAHQKLDQARLLFEEAGEEDRAARSWELEQKLYGPRLPSTAPRPSPSMIRFAFSGGFTRA